LGRLALLLGNAGDRHERGGGKVRPSNQARSLMFEARDMC
jgi:hypothetical protein